jgi:hypothetical protein
MQRTMQDETTCMVQLICYQTSVEYSFRRDHTKFESMAAHSYQEQGRKVAVEVNLGRIPD